MSEPSVDKWKQRGRVCVWNHKQRHVDWNIAADEVGCEALIDLLDRMKAGRWSSQKSLVLIKPQRTATGVPEHRAVFASELVLKSPKLEVTDDFWSLEETGATVKLVIGLSRLHQLRNAISDMKDGGGDYCIGSNEAPLWIWWFVD